MAKFAVAIYKKPRYSSTYFIIDTAVGIEMSIVETGFIEDAMKQAAISWGIPENSFLFIAEDDEELENFDEARWILEVCMNEGLEISAIKVD